MVRIFIHVVKAVGAFQRASGFLKTDGSWSSVNAGASANVKARVGGKGDGTNGDK